MKLYYCNTQNFQSLYGCELLLDDRQAQIRNYKNKDDKIRALVAGLMTRQVLGNLYYTNISYGAHGKPIISGCDNIHFNISHSGNHVILGVSETIIGVDIEFISSPSKLVAKKCFTDAEFQWFESVDDITAFYKLWTGKESVIKAFGEGFHMNPNSFDILPIENGPHTINEVTWSMYWETLDEYQICVIAEGLQPAPIFTELFYDDLII